MTLGEYIKITRQKALLSQEEFAKELGVSHASVNRWECGKSRPNITAMKSVRHFCKTHDLPYHDIETAWIAR